MTIMLGMQRQERQVVRRLDGWPLAADQTGARSSSTAGKITVLGFLQRDVRGFAVDSRQRCRNVD